MSHGTNLRGNAVEQLTSHASDIGADIIVAGAYGHTRLREWMLGGVTRDLITISKVCSVLSHSFKTVDFLGMARRSTVLGHRYC